MINFSKVSRQLSEARDPETGNFIPDRQLAARQKQIAFQNDRRNAERDQFMQRNPIVRRGQQNQDLKKFNKAGERGRRFESKISELLNHLSPRDDNPISGANHRVLGGRMKADIMNDDGVGYSVKTKMNNDDPMKVQQSSYDSTLWSKLNIPWAKRAQSTNTFTDDIKDNKLAQALVMRFGSKFGSLDKIGELINDELNPDQMKILQNFNPDSGKSKNPFMSNEEMFNAFPEHYETLLGHLNDNKYEIFNSLVRQAGGQNGDANPIQRFISHMTDEGVSGSPLDVDSNGDPIYNFSGNLDVHDMSDETVQEAMKKLQWFGTGNRFYMAENETDDINERLLDLWPYDEEGTSWALRPGDGNKQNDITPGFFKAMMSANPELLERLFPSTLRGKIQFDKTNMRNVFKNLNNRNEEVMNFNKLHFRESLEVEQSSAEKATMSGEKQNANLRRQRQKDQMAQKSPVSKSGVVYASEDYFRQIREGSKLIRAQDKARQDWRQDLEEGKGKDGPQDEGDHPYIRLMPKTNQIPQKKKEEKMTEIQAEQVSFEDALENLIEAEKPFDPDARRKQRGAMLKKQAQNAPKDTRTDAQKMADATGPRPGSRYRGD